MKKTWVEPTMMELRPGASRGEQALSLAVLRYHEEEWALALYGNYVHDKPPAGIFGQPGDRTNPDETGRDIA